MGHNINHYVYPRFVNKKQVQKELDNYVAHEDWQEGCRGLTQPIRWLEDKVYGSEEEAHEAIKRLDRGWYDQLAVLFQQNEEPHDDRIRALRVKCAEAGDEFRRRDQLLYSQAVKSAYIGCKQCGSRLARNYLKVNSCPVCHAELRPEHMLKSVSAAKAKWEKAKQDVEEYKKKKGAKKVCWLVKIEYHT